MGKNVINMIYNGLAGRYSRDNKINIIVISEKEEALGLWDSDQFNYWTGQILTKDLVDTSYVEIDSTANPKEIKIKLIPEILLC